MAAFGGYIGVIRAIEELRAEIKVLRVEHRAAMSDVERRLERVEAAMTREVATRRDLAATREAIEREVRLWMAQHERTHRHERRE